MHRYAAAFLMLDIAYVGCGTFQTECGMLAMVFGFSYGIAEVCCGIADVIATAGCGISPVYCGIALVDCGSVQHGLELL